MPTHRNAWNNTGIEEVDASIYPIPHKLGRFLNETLNLARLRVENHHTKFWRLLDFC